jgi:hypothetical protein
MIIEMCDDMIRISHGFDGCQMMEYIADSNTSTLRTGDDDITTFLRPLKVHRCWSNHKILEPQIFGFDRRYMKF